MFEHIKKSDPDIAKAMSLELNRQRNNINLIASENYASLAVLEAAGSVLTNKYSEGYPKKRYYAGNEFIDICEELAIERLKKLFNSEHANVQPHSGSQANLASFLAFLKPGDKIMSMNLAHGGHLTHGSPVNISGMWFDIIPYGVDSETEKISMEDLRKTALKEKPKLIIAGASAYPREIDFREFREIADEAGAYLLADIAHIAGLIAAGLHNSSLPYADATTSTTQKTLRGPRGGIIMANSKHAEKIDKAVFPGLQGGPLEHIIAAKAVAFQEALQPGFSDYQKHVVENSKTLGETLTDSGFRLVTGGTDNHLILVDLTEKNISGMEAQNALEKANIIVNKNMIPFDKRRPWDPSGIRIGTPAVTTRGLSTSEIKFIAECIANILSDIKNNSIIESCRKDMQDMCKKFPLYPELGG